MRMDMSPSGTVRGANHLTNCTVCGTLNIKRNMYTHYDVAFAPQKLQACGRCEASYAYREESAMTDKITSPIKAIRAKCLECSCTANEVKMCPITDCALYPFRYGKNPYRTKRELTGEQKAALTERLTAAKKRKN